MEKRLEQQMNFLLEVDKLKNIYRQTYVTQSVRQETDAEHSWHIALMAILLSEYSDKRVDILKVVKMLLVHDIIEIDAGDTYAYDEKGNLEKPIKEKRAADRIFSLLPEDQAKEYFMLWDEFEQCQTDDAKYARTFDRIQPIMLNIATEGKAWSEHDVILEQVLKRNAKTHEGSQVLWDCMEERLNKAVSDGILRESR